MKNIPIDRRRLRSSVAAGGLTTRCRVERQRSLVQRIIKSPRLTVNAPSMTGTGTHRPARSITSRPPISLSLYSNVIMPRSLCAPARNCPGRGRDLRGRIMDYAQLADVPVDFVIEEIRCQIECLGKNPAQRLG